MANVKTFKEMCVNGNVPDVSDETFATWLEGGFTSKTAEHVNERFPKTLPADDTGLLTLGLSLPLNQEWLRQVTPDVLPRTLLYALVKAAHKKGVAPVKKVATKRAARKTTKPKNPTTKAKEASKEVGNPTSEVSTPTEAPTNPTSET